MKMRFRFIRTGDNPVDEGANEFEIRECFACCIPKVKTKLETFLNSKKESVTFEFEGQAVEIRREDK